MKKFTVLTLISAGLIAVNVRADSMKPMETPAPALTQAPATNPVPTLVTTPAHAPATAPVLISDGKVLKENVNVRSHADKNAEVITQLKKGTNVEVKERKGDWLCIVAPAHAKCYVSAKLLKAGVATADAVHIRCGAGTNFKDIGKLSKGEKVEVVETKGEWTQIKPTGSCIGWVSADLIEVAPPTPVPAPIQIVDTVILPPAPVPAPTPAPSLVPAPAAVPVKLTDISDEVHMQYVVKDGYLAAVTESNAPAAYALMTENIMRREYIRDYLDAPAGSLKQYEGKHVRVLGNQRWKHSERVPVIAVERCEVVW